MKYRASQTIAVLSVFALFGAFAASGEPAIAPLQGTAAESALNALSYPNALVFNLCIGFLVGAFIWLLNVALPERQIRLSMKRSLAARYRTFRLDMIGTVLYSYSGNLPEQICEPSACYAHFVEVNSALTTEFAQRLRERPELVERVAGMIRLLVREVEYVLQKLDLDDEVHEVLKDLTSAAVLVLRSGDYGPSELKNLRGFVFRVLYAYPFTDKPGTDHIGAAISKI